MISFILDVCFSFWEILTHLSWSLLEIEQDSNPLNSVDTPSVALAKLLYAVFLFIAVILLVNMLIALLSHTYQRVKVSTNQSSGSIKFPLNACSFALFVFKVILSPVILWVQNVFPKQL